MADVDRTLDDAVKRADVAAVKALVQTRGALSDEEATAAFRVAFYRGDLEFVKWLIERGVDLNLREPQYGATLFMRALMDNHFAIGEYLLAQGADINSRNNLGHTALHHMIPNEVDTGTQSYLPPKTTGTIFLIEHGADVNARDLSGETPLDLAIAQGHPAAAVILRAHGAVQGLTGKAATPYQLAWDRLWNAVLSGDVETVLHFLHNEQNTYEDLDPAKNALTAAAFYGCLPILEALVAANVDLTMMLTDNNWPALLLTIGNGQLEAAEYLLAHGADVNWTGRNGQTALLRAFAFEIDTARIWHRPPETTLTEFLLVHGAAVNAVSRYGTTPLDIAIHLQHHAAAELLRVRGAVRGPGAPRSNAESTP